MIRSFNTIQLGSALDIGHFQETELKRGLSAVSLRTTVDFSCRFVQCQGLTPCIPSLTRMIYRSEGAGGVPRSFASRDLKYRTILGSRKSEMMRPVTTTINSSTG